jgi:hypothetical protein
MEVIENGRKDIDGGEFKLRLAIRIGHICL